ncbi:MAG: sensor domain-containing diguanylate cyclase [Methylococcaceae bacterium]|nr:sensor domain-containing diguanylate cyclase [Methylococcaceae bacterium]
MIKIIKAPFSFIGSYFTKSISLLVMSSLVLVMLVPLGFLATSLTQGSWVSVRQDILEKHRFLAKNLESTVNLFFKSQQQSLKPLTKELARLGPDDAKRIQIYLEEFLEPNNDIVTMSYIPKGSNISHVAIAQRYKKLTDIKLDYDGGSKAKGLATYDNYYTKNYISSVFKSTISDQPVILLKQNVVDDYMNKKGTLLVELSLSFIRKTCDSIRFGERGHCAILDSKGLIVAHPNEEWVDEIRDLSKTDIFKKAKEVSEEGIVKFYSPFLKMDMISGFVQLEHPGWKIYINQPVSELGFHVKKVVKTVSQWLAFGILISLIIAHFLTQKITAPINELAVKAREARIRSETFTSLGKAPESAPLEIRQMYAAISALIQKLSASSNKVKKMNYSLEKDIQKATAKLTATNKYLYTISTKDHLTKIANRRYFEMKMEKILQQASNERIGIILIDVDKFKFINDEYGHDAGDLALKHISKILHESSQGIGFPARLGGDEFVVYIKNPTQQALFEYAEKLRQTVQNSPIVWHKDTIKLTALASIKEKQKVFIGKHQLTLNIQK